MTFNLGAFVLGFGVGGLTMVWFLVSVFYVATKPETPEQKFEKHMRSLEKNKKGGQS